MSGLLLENASIRSKVLRLTPSWLAKSVLFKPWLLRVRAMLRACSIFMRLFLG